MEFELRVWTPEGEPHNKYNSQIAQPNLLKLI